MKKVLLTGATGFIGRQCLTALAARGYEVHAVARAVPEPADTRATWHRADLLDSGQAAALAAQVRPESLLHLAWYTAPGRYLHSLENFRWVGSSLALLEAFASHGGRRIVTAGTCFEYDFRDGVCNERSTALAPTTPYATCKHCLRRMIDLFAQQAGLSGAWGRIFYVYGPGEHSARLVSSVAISLLRGRAARCSHGRQVRDYLHVRDAGDAMVTLLDSDVTGPVNIASGRGTTVAEIIGRIAEDTGRGELVELGTVPVGADEPPMIVADVERLTQEVGWQMRYDLDNGIAQTVQWWRENLPEENR